MALPGALRWTLGVALDGEPVPGFPIVRRVTGNPAMAYSFRRAADGDVGVYQEIPLPAGPIQALLLVPAGPVSLALNGAVDLGVVPVALDAGGVCFVSLTTLFDSTSRVALANPGTTAVDVAVTAVGFDT